MSSASTKIFLRGRRLAVTAARIVLTVLNVEQCRSNCKGNFKSAKKFASGKNFSRRFLISVTVEEKLFFDEV